MSRLAETQSPEDLTATPRNMCGVSFILKSLFDTDVELAEELMAWFDRTGYQHLTGAQIGQICADEGFELSQYTANRHRRAQCSCDFPQLHADLAAHQTDTKDA